MKPEKVIMREINLLEIKNKVLKYFIGRLVTIVCAILNFNQALFSLLNLVAFHSISEWNILFPHEYDDCYD